MPAILDRYIRAPEARDRHETVVRAPADLVLEVAEAFDLQSISVVHGIFWLRAKVLGAAPPPRAWSQGLLAAMRDLGWGVLEQDRARPRHGRGDAALGRRRAVLGRPGGRLHYVQ